MMKSSLSLLLALCSLPAAALEFNQVQTGTSSVTFHYKQMGVPMDGNFGKFAAQMQFDPAKPAQAKARIEIDIASIDAGSTEANDEVVGKPWFNAKAFPVASFVSSALKPLGGNRYEASGKLTIKGHAQEVKVPVTFTATGANGQFDGVLPIKRLDYAIGEGEWTDVSTVANEIAIQFHLVVQAVPSKK